MCFTAPYVPGGDQLKKGQTYLDLKPVYHIGFLDYDIKGFTPEFYSTYMLSNIKNHEIFSSKFALSVVNLKQIDKATAEDRKYGIDHWVRLFKAENWEAIKQMARTNEYISDAAQTMFESSQDVSIRTFCEGVEEANRLRRTLELQLEQAQKETQAQKAALAQKDAEIARLKALLEKAK